MNEIEIIINGNETDLGLDYPDDDDQISDIMYAATEKVKDFLREYFRINKITVDWFGKKFHIGSPKPMHSNVATFDTNDPGILAILFAADDLYIKILDELCE